MRNSEFAANASQTGCGGRWLHRLYVRGLQTRPTSLLCGTSSVAMCPSYALLPDHGVAGTFVETCWHHHHHHLIQASFCQMPKYGASNASFCHVRVHPLRQLQSTPASALVTRIVQSKVGGKQLLHAKIYFSFLGHTPGPSQPHLEIALLVFLLYSCLPIVITLL